LTEVDRLLRRVIDSECTIIIIIEMINSIGKESSLTESNHKIECQVYDDLSTFMQIFKKLLTAIEELTLSRLKELPKDNAKEKFKELS
jgi:hypothetical protein